MLNAPHGRQSTALGVPGCQPQDSPPSRTDCSLLSRVSCDEGGKCASCLLACLSGSVVESALLWARSHAASNLLGEGLPTWAWDSPSTQEPWQCQTRGPTEPPRPSCQGQQLTAGPSGDGVMTPSSLQSGPCTHQHRFGTFSYHSGGGLEALESRTTLTGSVSSTFQSTGLKSCGESRECTEGLAQEGRAGHVWPSGLFRTGSAGPRPPAGRPPLPSRPGPIPARPFPVLLISG